MKIPSKEKLNQLLRYDLRTGALYWKSRSACRIQEGDEAGWVTSRGYRKIQIEGKDFYAHRIIWMMVHGVEPDEIDHINGNKDDNRLKNLRSVLRVENTKNMKTPIRNTSGVMGVSWHKPLNKWRVQINIDKKKKHLGYFTDIAEATKCRKDAENQYKYHANHGRLAA